MIVDAVEIIESECVTSRSPMKLASTASTLALVNVSTPTIRPNPNVKNPAPYQHTELHKLQQLRHSPLIPARIVELPTLVNPKLAFTLQFAANHAKQKTAANEAVSLVESFA
jgi:hypothetical protein